MTVLLLMFMVDMVDMVAMEATVDTADIAYKVDMVTTKSLKHLDTVEKGSKFGFDHIRWEKIMIF